MKIKKFNENLATTPGDMYKDVKVDLDKAMENRKISDLTVKEFKELIRMIVSSELSKRVGN